MNLCIGVLVIILGFVSQVHPRLAYPYEKNANYDNIFNKITVDFPSDVCDTRPLEVPDFKKPGRRISEVKCLEYAWKLKYNEQRLINANDCFHITYGTTGLLGGREAEYGEYPHMGALGWKSKNDSWIFKCGSSLISEKFLLTAAHCSQVAKSDRTVAQRTPSIVRLGGKNINDIDGDDRGRDVSIHRIIVHPRYKAPRHYYDIALIELKNEVSYTWRIHPACLWDTFENPEKGVLTGWGVVDIATLKTSPILQTAEIPIIDSVECDKTLKSKQNRNWWTVMRHQLCAGHKPGGIDTCQGDSGGPLQVLISMTHPIPVFRWSLHHIVGVTSFGFGCARPNTPGIYTRVASFLGWIEIVVWGQQNVTENLNSSKSSAYKNDVRIYFDNSVK